MKAKSLLFLLLAVGLPPAGAAESPAAAQSAGEHAGHHASGMATPSSQVLTEGEVRRIDKSAKKITIRHGVIPNLDMPPMTMVFQVADPALLDTVKPGDKIRFTAEKAAGGYVATRIEAAK
jgi:Cu(I)/Ag(I) efflux system protein CusF